VGKTEALTNSVPWGFRPMDEAVAQEILTWRYETPYDIYNLNVEDADEVVSCFVDPVNAYHAIVDKEGGLVAYCCFGPEGQVPGGDYDNPALDVGMGVHPDLTGKGLGGAIVDAVLRFARQEQTPTTFRVTVAEFNERAQRVWKKAGFQPVQRFERTFDGMPFVILTRMVDPGLAGGS
jgi:ribosomal-protein-alanine N-acetyltransferase